MSGEHHVFTGDKDAVVKSLESDGFTPLDLDYPANNSALLYTLGVLRNDSPLSGHFSCDGVVPLYAFVEVQINSGFYTGKQMLLEFANFDQSSLQLLGERQLLLISGFEATYQPRGCAESAHLLLRADSKDSKIWIVGTKFLSSRLPTRQGHVCLADLSECKSFNLYVVVISFNCRNNDDGSTSLTMKVLDSSIRPDRPVTCRIRFAGKMRVPSLKDQGYYIARFHRISCSPRCGTFELHGTVGRRGMSLEFWHCVIGSEANRLPCAHNVCSVNEDDGLEVNRLRLWYEMDAKNMKPDLAEEPVFQSVDSFTPGAYHDLIAKVVCVFPSVLFSDCTIIRATDGTSPPPFTSLVDLEGEQLADISSRAQELMDGYSNLLFDIFAYGSHAETAKLLKFAQYVAFFNLHMHYKVFQPMQAALTVHSGNIRGRRLEVLDPSSNLLDPVKQRVQSYFPDEAN
uniref:POT1PC domain-containing protein n=1 Tax=Trichuris muris TaxID=70415 RepID=A0A5S6R089_TRIMR